MRPLFIVLLLCSSMGCRTTDDSNTKQPVQTETQDAGSHNGKTVLLKRVVGGLTQNFPENRVSECVIYREDTKASADILKDLGELKGQKLQEGFIFRPQIPSIQIFGYLDKDPILLQEIGAEKAQYRIPGDNTNPGNPRLALSLNTIQEFCGDAK